MIKVNIFNALFLVLFNIREMADAENFKFYYYYYYYYDYDLVKVLNKKRNTHFVFMGRLYKRGK